MSFSDFLEHLNHFSRFMLKDSRVNENLLAERLLWTGMCFFFGRPRRPCVLCVLTLGYQPGSDVLRKGFLYVGRPVEDWTIEGITPVYVHEAWIKLFLFSEFVPACVFIKKKTRKWLRNPTWRVFGGGRKPEIAQEPMQMYTESLHRQ